MNKKTVRPENDINRLSNQQVVLLALLVAIISAVTAALVVVQVYDQNPSQTVVNTVNRVTETIIEREEGEETIVERTIVIKEGDLVAKAVELNRNATVEIESINQKGFVLPGNRIVAIESAAIEAQAEESIAATRHANAEGFSLWSYEGSFDQVGVLSVKTREPLNLGETVVLLSADGSIERGIINSINEGQIGFSGAIPADTVSTLVDLSGKAIGLSVGGVVYTTEYVQSLYDRDPISIDDKQDICQDNGGVFLAEHGECVGIGGETCAVLGGSFDLCASACRHDADAEICTQQCVLVCQL